MILTDSAGEIVIAGVINLTLSAVFVAAVICNPTGFDGSELVAFHRFLEYWIKSDSCTSAFVVIIFTLFKSALEPCARIRTCLDDSELGL